MFDLVRRYRYKGNIKEALSRIAFLLDYVGGHRRYGKRSTALLQDSVLGRDKPEKYREILEPKIVQLHHCLAAIASRLTLGHEERIQNLLAGKYEINPQSEVLKSLLSMFRYLIHQQVVTEDDQREIVEVLFNVGAKHLLHYLKNYRIRNHLSLDDYPKLKNAGAYGKLVVLLF